MTEHTDIIVSMEYLISNMLLLVHIHETKYQYLYNSKSVRKTLISDTLQFLILHHRMENQQSSILSARILFLFFFLGKKKQQKTARIPKKEIPSNTAAF